MYYIYILRCSDHTLYTGITNHLEKRMHEHFTHSPKAAKYTLSHHPLYIAALFTCENRSRASKLEYAIKHLPKAKKEALIAFHDQSLPLSYIRLYAFPLIHII